MSSVLDFGARGDGKVDDRDAIQHALDMGEGIVEFPPGDYLISKPINVDLTHRVRAGISGSGGTAKVIMAGAGPAFRVVGSHKGTAGPGSFDETTWRRQRLPTIENIEVEGRHAEADGLEMTGTMQAIVSQVALRKVRHGIRLVNRNRNVIISNCQIYHNRGAGIFLDGVNLHQINIIGNHISYNRLGGIRVERSEIRNLQITGNDIEYNTDRTHKLGAKPTGEIFVDTTAKGATVNEIAITSNTIQAQPSANSANIRVIESLENNDRPPGLWTIAGNVIGSQTNNVHLTGCYGVTITGNTIYSCQKHNVLLERCRQVVLGANVFRRHTSAGRAGVRMDASADCLLSGCQFFDEEPEGQLSGISLLELANCERINVSGCSIIDGVPYGVHVVDSRSVNISGCTIVEARREQRMHAALRVEGRSGEVLVTGCRIGKGTKAAIDADDDTAVVQRANLVDGDEGHK